MRRRNEWSTFACPRCGAREDTHHVWKCPHSTAAHIRATGLQDLKSWLLRTGTDPTICTIFMQRLYEWLSDLPLQPVSNLPLPYQQQLELQDASGWELPFTGMWHIGWSTMQTNYFSRRLNSRRTGVQWLSQVTRRVWDIAWSLWMDRNNILHNKEERTAHLEVVSEIRGLYQRRHEFPTFLQPRFIPLNQLLAKTKEAQKAWLVAFHTYRKAGNRHLDRQTRQRRRLLRSIGNVTVPVPIPLPDTSRLAAVRQALREYRLRGARNLVLPRQTFNPPNSNCPKGSVQVDQQTTQHDK